MVLQRSHTDRAARLESQQAKPEVEQRITFVTTYQRFWPYQDVRRTSEVHHFVQFICYYKIYQRGTLGYRSWFVEHVPDLRRTKGGV